MTQIFLDAGDVDVYEYSPSDPPYEPSVFVGAKPWAYLDPAYIDTYTTGWTTHKTGPGQFAHLAGDFVLPAAPAGVAQLTVFMHYKATNVGPDASGGRARFSFVKPSNGETIFAFTVGDPGDPDYFLIADGITNNLLWQPQPGVLPMSLQDTVEALADEGGFTLIVDRGAGPGDTSDATPLNQYSLTIYSLGVAIDYGIPRLRTPAPPARLSGRMDGRGPLGGPRRLDTIGPSRQSGFHPGGYN